MQKLAIRENCASEENKYTIFVVILQVKTLIAIVYRLQEKNMQITLNALWIFIKLFTIFVWQHLSLNIWADGRLNAYLSLRRIY